MSLRKEIESLALWFVTASIIVLIFSLFVSTGLESLIDRVNREGFSVTAFQFYFTGVNYLIHLIDNFAVGGWLFSRASKSGYNRYLWCLFGVAGSLVGGALYFLSRYSEANTSNKLNQSGPSQSDAPV